MTFLTSWIENSSLFNKPDGAAGLSQMQTVYAAFAVCWAVFLIFDWTGIDLPRKKLKRKDTVDWHSRVISSIHAIILCVGKAAAVSPLCNVYGRKGFLKGSCLLTLSTAVQAGFASLDTFILGPLSIIQLYRCFGMLYGDARGDTNSSCQGIRRVARCVCQNFPGYWAFLPLNLHVDFMLVCMSI